MPTPQKAAEIISGLNSKLPASSNPKELLPSLTASLKELISCEAVTLYSIDRAKRQIVSRNHEVDGIPELRVDITTKSLAGYVCSMGKSLSIANAYSKSELMTYHADLGFGSARDASSGFKTRSALLIPLASNKKLVGLVECLNRQGADRFTPDDFKYLRDVSVSLGMFMAKMEDGAGAAPAPAPAATGAGGKDDRLLSLTHSIHAANNVDEILLEQKNAIMDLFGATNITIYAIDTPKNEIYSKVKSGTEVSEIRVPVSPKSIAGCVAMEQRMVNISNVYNEKELKDYHPELVFDSSWDHKTGFKTQSMLVSPLLNGNKLMGVIQLINKKSGPFTTQDEKNLATISETLALAFHNQGKMVEQKPTKFSHLLSEGLITDDELTTAIANARKNQLDIETILLKDLGLKRKDIGKSLENFYKIPYQGYSDTIVLPQQVMVGLNKNFLLKNFWLPLQAEDNKVSILINDPTNPEKIQNIKLLFPKKQFEFKVGLKVDIVEFLNSTLGADEQFDSETKSEEFTSLLKALDQEKEQEGVATEGGEKEDDAVNAISESDSTIVRLVNKVLTDAYDQNVSDIHIEPGTGKDNILVRFRKDGACKIYEEIPYVYKQAVLSRIKIMSRLDIAERRLPQDGKIKMKYGKKEVEFRVATCPTVGGNEDAVLRILAASKPIPLDNMNFTPRNLSLIKAMVDKPYGLILVVGPTGSGKTTTLHSCLGFINTPEIKIWTAEDPVEITQKGLRQVQMQSKIGLDFARTMRSFLRGDPDVIMVGEMRDAETCAIGLEASLTGHMVFSTLHTNSAPETITRLLDMGMNPLNFADALLLIVAQRLCRTLCKDCKKDYHPTREEFQMLAREYGEDLFPKLGKPYTDTIMIKQVGNNAECPRCGGNGYAGRTGLHELLEGTPKMKRMIMQKAFVEELREQAIQDGMTTLKQDGIYKVLNGDTDLKQVLSVCIA